MAPCGDSVDMDIRSIAFLSSPFDVFVVTVLGVGGMSWQRVLAYNALAGAAVTWAGKAAGGYLGDRFERWIVTAPATKVLETAAKNMI